MLPIGACVLCILAARAVQQPQDSQANDQLAWQTVAENTKAFSSASNTTQETAVSWRLWATSQDVYGSAPQSPAAFVFPNMRPLPCRQSAQNPKATALSAKCEVVFINPVATQYTVQNGLPKRETLISVAQTGLSFPDQSITLKTEWIPITSKQSDFVIGLKGGERYGLVAFNMKAKVLPNSQWLWATFIQKDHLPPGLQTKDSFGLKPDHSSISMPLQTLLASDDASVLSNYVLIGTQTNLDLGTKGLLGNPLIEGLTDPTLQHSSCVGCHNTASISRNGLWWQPSVLKNASPPIPPGKLTTDGDWGAAGKAKCGHVGNDCIDGQAAARL